jgi:ubiquinol-cytochrome c reductase iron-sulfur subunit
MSERRAERIAAAAFIGSLLSGLGLFAVYLGGGQTQVEAVLLTICVGGIGVGMVVWSHALMPNEHQEEERHPIRSDAETREEVVRALGEGVGRRTFLLRLLGVAFVGLGAALALPVLSLGPAPGRSLFQTEWRSGLRLVDINGNPVNAADLPVESIVTVFPEGSPGSADAQTVLLRVAPERLQLQGDAAAWAPSGFVAYSKLCTHAGCPVGLFRAETGQLVCPCHQSTFDVLRGAVPMSGPAARALPQLPMRLEADGTFTCLSDFTEPVGPSFWDMDS